VIDRASERWGESLRATTPLTGCGLVSDTAMSGQHDSDQVPGNPAEPRCAFCGRMRFEAGPLVEGSPRPTREQAYICLACAEECAAVISTLEQSAADAPPEGPALPQCSYCGTYYGSAGELIASPLPRNGNQEHICPNCVTTSIAVIRQATSPTYSRAIWLSALGFALFYAAACLHPEVWQGVQNSLPEAMHHPLVAIPSMFVAGAAMGMELALFVAPTAWLNSQDGRWWMRGAGTTNHRVFRLWVAKWLFFCVLATCLLVRALVMPR